MNKKKKDLAFYTKCLKTEMELPFHKQDFGYLIHLDTIIYNLKQKQL